MSVLWCKLHAREVYIFMNIKYVFEFIKTQKIRYLRRKITPFKYLTRSKCYLAQKSDCYTSKMLTENSPKYVLIIGISGVTCGGKSTTASKLKEVLPKSTIFSQDDYFRDINDPMHVWIPELNHYNFDIISSLDMEKMYSDVLKFIEDNNFSPINNEQTHQNRCPQPESFNSHLLDTINKLNIHILIIEGFSIFSFKKWLYLFSLKYYLTLEKKECYERRLKRVYEPPDVPGYFDKCVWPEYLKQKEEILKSVNNVKFACNIVPDFFKTILVDIFQLMCSV